MSRVNWLCGVLGAIAILLNTGCNTAYELTNVSVDQALAPAVAAEAIPASVSVNDAQLVTVLRDANLFRATGPTAVAALNFELLEHQDDITLSWWHAIIGIASLLTLVPLLSLTWADYGSVTLKYVLTCSLASGLVIASYSHVVEFDVQAAGGNVMGNERGRMGILANEEALEKGAAQARRVLAAKLSADTRTLERIRDAAAASNREQLDYAAAEERRNADAERRAKEERLANASRLAEQRRIANEKRLATQRRVADERRAAEERRVADARRVAEDERLAAAARAAEEERVRLANRPRATAKVARRTFVLVVGINPYGDKGIPDLRFAEADARAVFGFYATDTRSPTGRDRVKLLIGAKATRLNVLKAIRQHLSQKATEPTDAAVLYFAGHGFSDADETYLACTDTQIDNLMETGIALSTLQIYWSRIAAGTKLLITDACHAGGLANLRGLTVRRRAIGVDDRGVTAVIAAAGANEVSTEDEELGQGVFTQVLLNGLRGNADADRNGSVTINELSRFLKRKVPARAREVEGNQTPVIEVHGKDGASVVLTR
jgi:hypothetical protein